jgi:hypothetical protein
VSSLDSWCRLRVTPLNSGYSRSDELYYLQTPRSRRLLFPYLKERNLFLPGLGDHGKKGKAMIHIGAVDAPVTIAEIDAAVDECVKLKQGELHVLGWEWEMGLYDLMVDASKKKNVKLSLFQIPRELMEQEATARGDVRFFELAYLDAAIKRPKKLTALVELKDFVIPNTDHIPRMCGRR